MPDLFREEAVRELGDPRGLDEAITLVRPRGWVALAAFGVLALAAVVWAVFGRLDYRVDGLAVLLHEGSRIIPVTAPADGRVIAVHVRKGQQVTKGALLAELSLPALEAQISALDASIAALEDEIRLLAASLAQENAADEKELEKALAAHEQALAAARQKETFLARKLADDEALLKKGFATKEAVEATRQEWLAARQDVLTLSAEIVRLRAQAAATRTDRAARLDDLKRTLLQEKGRRTVLVATKATNGRLLADEDGLVVAVEELPGRRVAAGQPILTIETKGGPLAAYAYFPLAAGKKLAQGNAALVAPTTVERSLYGAMKAHVTRVDALPSDRADLLARFGNEALVRQIMGAGAPLAARLALEPAPGTASGFAWTSSKGPAVTLSPGTLAAATVVVRRIRPISLLVPVIEELAPAEEAHATTTAP